MHKKSAVRVCLLWSRSYFAELSFHLRHPWPQFLKSRFLIGVDWGFLSEMEDRSFVVRDIHSWRGFFVHPKAYFLSTDSVIWCLLPFLISILIFFLNLFNFLVLFTSFRSFLSLSLSLTSSHLYHNSFFRYWYMLTSSLCLFFLCLFFCLSASPSACLPLISLLVMSLCLVWNN